MLYVTLLLHVDMNSVVVETIFTHKHFCYRGVKNKATSESNLKWQHWIGRWLISGKWNLRLFSSSNYCTYMKAHFLSPPSLFQQSWLLEIKRLQVLHTCHTKDSEFSSSQDWWWKDSLRRTLLLNDKSCAMEQVPWQSCK